VINHRVNGLDLTAWSPSHLLLYTGTAIMVVGVLRNWHRTYPRDGPFARQWHLGLVALFAFLFEDLYFPTGQQEYGVLEVASWLRGTPSAEPSLLSFAAGQLGRPVDDVALQHFAMPIAPWVYPVWVIAVCVPLLVVARMLVGRRWTATAVVAGYVGYRCVIWPLLTVGTFPPSYLPFWLLPLAVAVDVVFLLRVPPYPRAVLGGCALAVLGYGALWLSTVLTGTPVDLAYLDIARIRAAVASGASLVTPPIAWGSIGVALPLSVLAWFAATRFCLPIAGSSTGKVPAVTVPFSEEPLRNARGALDGWAPSTAGSLPS
jgi:hypothetical protein